jgi:hypothetical protein
MVSGNIPTFVSLPATVSQQLHSSPPFEMTMTSASRVAFVFLAALVSRSLEAQRTAVVPAGVDTLRPPQYTNWSPDSVEAFVVDLAMARLIQAIATGDEGMVSQYEDATGPAPTQQSSSAASTSLAAGGPCANATSGSVAPGARATSRPMRWTIAPRTRSRARENGMVVYRATLVLRGPDGQSHSAPIVIRINPGTMRVTGESGVSQLVCEALNRGRGR